MSGGVDSAVALLRAGPKAVGVTLRLWIDPEAPDLDRACCSPEAVLAARRTCHSLGLPHVTLDAREDFLRAIVEPFVRGYERGETPNPCISCNGFFRFGAAARLREQAGARPTRNRPLRADRPASRAAAAGARDGRDEGPVVHARAPRSPRPRPDLVPARRADEGRDARRGGSRGARGRRADREPGGVLPRRRRLPRVPRAPRLAPDAGEIVDEHGEVVGSHQGFWRFTSGTAEGARRRHWYPAVRRQDPSRRAIASSSGRARRSRAERFARRASSTSTSIGPR